VPEQRFLCDDESVAIVNAFRRRHPRRTRLITAILGWGDLTSDAGVRAFVSRHPFVAFRPVEDRDGCPTAGEA
jgi:hypothetical protein